MFSRVILSTTLAAGLTASAVSGEPLQDGGFVAVTDAATRTVIEFNSDLDATIVSTVPRVPLYHESPNPYLGDVTVTPDGLLHVYNGQLDAVVSTVDPASWDWSLHLAFDGWNSRANSSYGGLDYFQRTLFLTDMATVGDGAPRGIVALDLDTRTFERFAETTSPIDLSVSQDDLLYVLEDDERTIHVYSPVSRSLVSTLTVDQDIIAIAADIDGAILAGDRRGQIIAFSTAGDTLRSIRPDFGTYVDIKVAGSGHVLASDVYGSLVLTDTCLADFTWHENYVGGNHPLRVAFVDRVEGFGGCPEFMRPPRIDSLRVSRAGDDVMLTWDPAYRAVGYEVYRVDNALLIDTAPTVGEVIQAAGPSVADVGAVAARPSIFYYDVVGVCETGSTGGDR